MKRADSKAKKQLVGRSKNAVVRPIHGFDGACAPGGVYCSHNRFSYGVFPLVPTKDGQRWKRGKVIVRVMGSTANADAVKAEAKRICDALDAGTYTGPKRVVVPWSNVRGQGTRHLVEGTLDPLVGFLIYGCLSSPGYPRCRTIQIVYGRILLN